MLQIGYTLYILITKIKLTINKSLSLELRKELRNTTSRCGGLRRRGYRSTLGWEVA